MKVVTTDTGLRVTAGIFEVTGASATKSTIGLDRFWRDIRIHTLHDPVAYKNRSWVGINCFWRFLTRRGILDIIVGGSVKAVH